MIHKDLAVLDRWRRAVAPTGQLKLAAEEGNETNYEKALSNIAHAYVQDIAPDLIQYELGFQLIEKSEDNNRALGVFGFKIGNLILYVPVFFLQGEIKGLDLLYIYNARQFVPLDQDWVRRLIGLAETVTGEPINAVHMSNRMAYPNLMQMKPTTLKWAMAQPMWLRPWLPFLVENKLRPERVSAPDPLSLVRKSASAAKSLAAFLEQHPRWLPIFHDFYGDDLRFALKEAEARELEQYPKFERRRRDPKVPSLDSSMEPADVDIYLDIHHEAIQKLTQNELETLRRQGYLIKDRRSGTTVIRPKASTLRYGALSPTKPGFHHLLLRDLSYVCAYVVPVVNMEAEDAEAAGRTTPAKYAVIPIYREDEEGNVLRRYSGDYGMIVDSRHMVATRYPKEDPNEKHSLSMFPTVRNLDLADNKTNEKYSVCFFTKASATPPLSMVEATERMHRGLRTLVSKTRPDSSTVVIDPKVFDRIEVHKHFLDGHYNDCAAAYHVPSNAHYVRIVTGDLPGLVYSDLTGEPEALAALRNELVTPDDLPNLLMKHADGVLKVAGTSTGEYVINGRPMNREQGLVTLLVNYGLQEKLAEAILDAIDEPDTERELEFTYRLPETPSRVRIYKKGQTLEPGPGQPPNVLAPQLPSMAAPTGMWGNQRMVTINEGYIPVDTPKPNVPAATDPLQPPPMLDQMLQTAIQSGQKEVFDTTVFSNLLNVTEDKDVVEQFLPDAFKGLDAQGKWLFNLYLHHDLFEERYGKEQVLELEQLLRNAFKAAGKVILRLQQRPIMQDSWAQYRVLMGL